MSETSAQKSRIILALDVDSLDKAVRLMSAVTGQVSMVKIGLELISAQLAGDVSKFAKQHFLDVFLDGKFDDIPTTMAKSVRAAGNFGVRMINVHANSGVEGMMAAVANKGDSLILAVTALTSIDTENVELDFGASRNAKFLYFARMAAYAGCDGIICSAKELAVLARYNSRKLYPELQLGKLIKVVPGTRSPGVDANDQKNVDTPANAVLNGADWLVIGREITDNPKESPRDAAMRINQDIAAALERRDALLKGHQ